MFRTIRRHYWVAKEFFKRHHTLITRTITLVIGLSLITALSVSYLPAPRPHFRIGLVGKFTPETLPIQIQTLLSYGMIKLDDNGNPQPALAKSWEVLEDGKKFVFHLDNTLRWHDGTALVGSDLNYNFNDVQVDATDNTITFILQDPFAPFFHAVTRPALKQGRLGVGEYQLAKSNVYSGILQSVVLISDRQKLTFKFYPTEVSAITAFKLGEIDELQNLAHIPPDLESDPNIQIAQNNHSPKQAVIFFNNNDQLLSSKPTRQALAYAVKDKSFGKQRADSPIPDTSWAYNSLVKSYQYDAERARTLFSQDNIEPSTITLELKTVLAHLAEAETIAEDWRETLGIQVDVKVVSNLSNDYQAFMVDFAPPDDPDQYTVWHSTQPTNFTHYTNLKVDKLLEDGRRTLDQKLRTEIYQDFQRFLIEDSPAIFLFNTTSYNLSRQKLLN